jgi:hypothetical protein
LPQTELQNFAGMNRIDLTALLMAIWTGLTYTACQHSSGLSKEEREKLRANTSGNWINRQWFDTLQWHGYPSRASHLPCMEIIVSHQMDSLAWIEPDQPLQVYPLKLLSDSSFSVMRNNRTHRFYYSANDRTLKMDDDRQQLSLKKLPGRYAVMSLDRWMSGLIPFINESLIAGTYRLAGPADTLSPPLTILTAYGEVAHLAGYKNYKLCMAENCFQTSRHDILILSDERSTDRYIWQWNSDTLQLYSVRNIGTLQNPIFIPHELIFSLIKAN